MKNLVTWVLIVILNLVVLIVACTQNSNSFNTPMNANRMMNGNSMNQNSMMNSQSMNRNMMNQNSSMNNPDMPKMMNPGSSPDAARQPYETQFLDTMTLHHQGAVEMAKMVLIKSQNDELKNFARQIIEDQNKEIVRMKDWREKWFTGKPAAINMEMPGMKDSMKMMSNDDLKMMDGMNNKNFDLHFLEMMIPHHTGAITMSKEALTKAEHAEIKTLANNIIKAQEAEIKMMNEWKVKWTK